MKCSTCRQDIDDDSQFCDQCGVLIARCAKCAAPLAASWCTRCGTPANAAATAPPPQQPEAATTLPRLRLRNKTLGLDIDMADHGTVGRNSGAYAAVFGAHERVSGRHCRFDYDPAHGWCVTDLGSTNKTHYNNKELPPNQPQAIQDGTFLKIANIEFFVSIEQVTM